MSKRFSPRSKRSESPAGTKMIETCTKILCKMINVSNTIWIVGRTTLRPRLHVSGSSGYPAPDRPFVYTYPGQMYAIRSITVRYPERFENDFKGGQPGCLDPFSSSVNGVPGHPDRFWIQFSMAKKNSSRLFTCRACSLSGAFD